MRFDGMDNTEGVWQVGSEWVMFLRNCFPIHCDNEADARKLWAQIYAKRQQQGKDSKGRSDEN